MVAANHIGICHICLRRDNLTFEHVPPKRAFNDGHIVAHTLNPPASAKGIPFGTPLNYRSGLGVRTLCTRCNNFTGNRYGAAFAKWVGQSLSYAEKYERVEGQENDILLPFHIEPLAVIKQLATMTLAVAGVSSNDAMRELRRFVLMPFERVIPPRINFRVYLNPRRSSWTQPQNKLNGNSMLMNVANGCMTHTIADIAFPPLGYWVAWVDGPKPPLPEFLKLADITHFGNYHLGQEDTVFLRMPVRLPVGPVAFHGTEDMRMTE